MSNGGGVGGSAGGGVVVSLSSVDSWRESEAVGFVTGGAIALVKMKSTNDKE